MTWPAKDERERLEIDGFIEAYGKLPDGKRFTVVSKGERPDYILLDDEGAKVGVELTSVYLNDRSVPQQHMPDETFSADENDLPAYRDRLASAVMAKIKSAQAGYNTEHPLILAVYPNEYVSIYMGEWEWTFLVKLHADIFENMDPFTEVVFWNLANGRVFSVTKSGSLFI